MCASYSKCKSLCVDVVVRASCIVSKLQCVACVSLAWELLCTIVVFLAYEVVKINRFLFCIFGVFAFCVKKKIPKIAVAKPFVLAHL